MTPHPPSKTELANFWSPYQARKVQAAEQDPQVPGQQQLPLDDDEEHQ